MKTYFYRLWLALLGKDMETQGGGGPGNPPKPPN